MCWLSIEAAPGRSELAKCRGSDYLISDESRVADDARSGRHGVDELVWVGDPKAARSAKPKKASPWKTSSCPGPTTTCCAHSVSGATIDDETRSFDVTSVVRYVDGAQVERWFRFHDLDAFGEFFARF